ncbi:hypothetical protein RAC89_06470 [Paenibacillus sp. GD4]|jgi:hypothetical protein|uniref:hypothetical protein n=1 Tax=Paenibacillus sp. GD4 TaxID=3068890 RepID=UPI002796A3B6|nr:hypothetical protein [Paenibacillus sp. GD4]MDQ1910141.1 hypothetical protein [Paenibacillus sp. GD4]
MNTPLEPGAPQAVARAAKPKNVKPRTYMFLFMAWTLLIALGVLGAKLYTDHLKEQLAKELAIQTEAQLAAAHADYEKQISALKDSITSDMANMQSKIDSINELLAFTKDSANSKTDNSNQLYTQLADVKKKLDELKKNLDALQ